MNLQNLSALLAAVITFVIGGSVFFRDRRQRPYVTFAILCFNLALWYLSSFFAKTLEAEGLLWVSLLFAVAIPTSVERFFRTFLAEDPRHPLPRSGVLLVGTIIAFLLLVYSGLLHSIHQHKAFQIPLYLFVFGSLYYSVLLIYKRQRELAARPESTRLKYLFYGGVISITLAATDFLPKLGVAFPTLGNSLTVIYIYFISQTLFHYRLLDIKELLGKMVTLSALVLILTVIYGLLLSWVGPGRPDVFFFNTIVASFATLVIFEQLKSWVEDRVNRWMFREKYEFSRRLQLTRRDLANIIEPGALVSRVLDSLEASGRTTHASIYLADPAGASYRLAGHVGPQPVDQLEGMTNRLFLERLKETGLLTVEALERDLVGLTSAGRDEAAVATRNILATMEELQASVCIPLIQEGQLLGILNLRDDRLREAYSSDELDSLRRLAAQATITLSNSKIYEQMKERERLAALGQMAAGLAHEIRNPLGAIKGAAQLLESSVLIEGPRTLAPDQLDQPGRNDGAGDAEAEAEVKEYVDIIVEEVNRLGRVVTQFLGYARPDRGERQELDINAVVERSLQILRTQGHDGIAISTELGRGLPPVQADPEQLRQVFLNLGINALQAMEDEGGALKVSTRLRRGTKRGRSASFIEINFQDSGPGIAQETLPDLFIPFFTTKERGTGLGLPICQRIVENHRGSIEVRSQQAKGSVFSVLLPSADDLTGIHQPP